MGFAAFQNQQGALTLLQRSLERGRLGHAYLFAGADLDELEAVARTLAKTLNCERPPRRGATELALDSCDTCPSCRKIEAANHPDIQWVRPESKSRVITVEQMRELMQTIYLKPTQAPFKVAVLVAADRLNVAAANAFLKTLEEPPADSIVVLLSTESQRLLETIVSRCLRLNFSGESQRLHEPVLLQWLEQFAVAAADEQRGVLSRYQLLSLMLTRLTELKATLEEALTKRSPLERYDDLDPKLKEKWEDELAAAIEAEYRRQRGDLLLALGGWLRDVWLASMRLGHELFTYPQLASRTEETARRVSSGDAMENLAQVERLQRQLASNVQEALALEVGLLRLKL